MQEDNINVCKKNLCDLFYSVFCIFVYFNYFSLMLFLEWVLFKFQNNFSSNECFDRRYFVLILTHFSGKKK